MCKRSVEILLFKHLMRFEHLPNDFLVRTAHNCSHIIIYGSITHPCNAHANQIHKVYLQIEREKKKSNIYTESMIDARFSSFFCSTEQPIDNKLPLFERLKLNIVGKCMLLHYTLCVQR